MSRKATGPSDGNGASAATTAAPELAPMPTPARAYERSEPVRSADGKSGSGVRVFIVFRDVIYASGLQATLAAAPGIESVERAPSIASALEHEALGEADVLLLDSDVGGAASLVQEIAVASHTRVLICLHESTSAEVLEGIRNGVAGVLARDLMTPDTVLAAVMAVAAGIFALDAAILRALTASAQGGADGSRTVRRSRRFTAREQMVLSLVAAGLSNREIAQRLSYSERTIKTVLHDIVTKLGVKSRSQAVALAVRERMI
jgi:DNA-binding NarL/FixJ family response regulator